METKTQKTQETLRMFQDILNELSPESYEELVEHVTSINLDTEESLKGAVGLIFDNFMSEDCYDVDYAIMSFRMLLVSYSHQRNNHHLVQSQHHIIIRRPVSLCS